MIKSIKKINVLKTYRLNKFSTIKFNFVLRDGSLKKVEAMKGQHILEVAKRYDLDLEGACEASLACSTCHVILPPSIYDQLEAPCEEEEDLLDLAFGLTGTSRLGCQVFISDLFEGSSIEIPKASRNLYVDGTKPRSH